MRQATRAKPWLKSIEGGGEQSEPIPRTAKWPIMGYCHSPDISPWFRVVDASDELAVEAAKAICELCIVKTQCLEFGLSLPERVDFAIWGGTTPEERVVIRQQMNEATPSA